MKFFDRKEEVLEIELTPHGRYLLSLGEWEPVYYSFFDDDIIYDSNYSGFAEDQNDTENRIKETVRTHVQVVFRDLNDEYDGSYQDVGKRRQSTFEREYSLSSELGITDFYSENAASWNVDFLKGEISSSVSTYTGSGPTFNIPQINTKQPTYDKIIGSLTPESGPDLFDEDLRTIVEFTTDFIEIREDFLLLEIEEQNVISQKENFEIELFEILNETDKAGNKFDRLKPLKFTGPRANDNTSYVDYYFNLDVDAEISEAMLCKYKDVDQTKGLFQQGAFDCDIDRDNTSADQYRSLISDIGEVCD